MDGCHDRGVFTCWALGFQGLTDRQTLLVFNVCVFSWGLFSDSVTRTVAMFRKTHVTLCDSWNSVTGARNRLHLTTVVHAELGPVYGFVASVPKREAVFFSIPSTFICFIYFFR